MDENKKSLTEEEWGNHVVKSERYKGSLAMYCRQNGLIYESLRRRRFERKKSTRSVPTATPAAFVKVETLLPAAASQKKNIVPQPLPDPEWLARFIYTYVSAGQ